MKLRKGFISNSSSSSFIIGRKPSPPEPPPTEEEIKAYIAAEDAEDKAKMQYLDWLEADSYAAAYGHSEESEE